MGRQATPPVGRATGGKRPSRVVFDLASAWPLHDTPAHANPMLDQPALVLPGCRASHAQAPVHEARRSRTS